MFSKQIKTETPEELEALNDDLRKDFIKIETPEELEALNEDLRKNFIKTETPEELETLNDDIRKDFIKTETPKELEALNEDVRKDFIKTETPGELEALNEDIRKTLTELFHRNSLKLSSQDVRKLEKQVFQFIKKFNKDFKEKKGGKKDKMEPESFKELHEFLVHNIVHQEETIQDFKTLLELDKDDIIRNLDKLMMRKRHSTNVEIYASIYLLYCSALKTKDLDANHYPQSQFIGDYEIKLSRSAVQIGICIGKLFIDFPRLRKVSLSERMWRKKNKAIKRLLQTKRPNSGTIDYHTYWKADNNEDMNQDEGWVYIKKSKFKVEKI